MWRKKQTQRIGRQKVFESKDERKRSSATADDQSAEPSVLVVQLSSSCEIGRRKVLDRETKV